MTDNNLNRDRIYDREAAFFDQDDLESHRNAGFLYDGYGPTLAVEQLYRFVDNVEGKCILEYGCGNGGHSFCLVSQGASVVGIDLSTQSVVRANQFLVRQIPPIQASVIPMNAERLAFENNSFDLILGVAILHHLDLRLALPEIHRTLKSGGAGVFLEAQGGNFFINLYRKFTPSKRTPDEHPLIESDFRLFKTYFEQVDIVGFYFTALLSFLLRVVWKNETVFIRLNKFLTDVDQKLIKAFPFLKRFCWMAVIRVKKNE